MVGYFSSGLARMLISHRQDQAGLPVKQFVAAPDIFSEIKRGRNG
jgi:hypothetical protein